MLKLLLFAALAIFIFSRTYGEKKADQEEAISQENIQNPGQQHAPQLLSPQQPGFIAPVKEEEQQEVAP